MAKSKRRVKRKKLKTLPKILIGVLLVLLILFGAFAFMLSPVSNTAQNKNVTIPSGSSLSEISSILKENGLIRSAVFYKLYIYVQGKQDDLHSGSYIFDTSMSSSVITEKLVKGAVRPTATITIREGYDLNRIASYLEEEGLFSADEFLSEIKNDFAYYKAEYRFLDSVPEDREYKLEGYLFGDTYEVYSDSTPAEVIIKMLDRFDDIFKEEYYDRCTQLGYSVDQVVTMASIVEREGILDSDLPSIASVFYNRLNAGMRLQSCATLQYIYKDYQFTFTNSQMEVDSPYNTYLYSGLPAGPISNFRSSALEAALYPATTGYYYFCSKNDGTGGTAFAATLDEHEANISKYSSTWE